jgi:hypothetical protein
MTADIKRICDRVDVTAPQHWDCAAMMQLLLLSFHYVIEISEHASLEWSDAAGEYVPVVGGWFVAIKRQPRSAEDYFPNEWEQDCLNLAGGLSERGFEYGTLEAMLDVATDAKRELEGWHCSSVVVFRPGPQWLPRSGRLAAVASHSRGAA